MIQPVAIGNALKLYLTPPEDAEYWRVLRKGTDDIADENDPYALVAYEGDDRAFVDCASLQNDIRAFYVPFYRVKGAWVRGDGNYGTPVADYEDYSTDVLSLVRDRLEAGLTVEVERGNLMNELGYIQVLTAPPEMSMNIAFPLVTVTLEDESPTVRGLGEDVSGEYEEGESSLEEDGWLADVRLNMVGWSFNPDERIALRKAIRRVMVGNLSLFASKGIVLPNLTLSDADAVNGEYGDAPMYLVAGDFTCTAPVRVGHMATGIIRETDAEVTNG